LSVTQAAIDAIADQVTKRGVEGTSLRVGVRGGGCSGYTYTIEFHDGEPTARDVAYNLTATDGSSVCVVVDRKSLVFLTGATLDWEETLMRRGFKFANPNERSSCGCGVSFTV
jgi:iron-sulfur cluster assembly protein